MLTRELEHLLRFFRLLQLEIGHTEHELDMSIRLLRFRTLQQVRRLLRVAGLHVQLTGDQQIIGAMRIGVNHLHQQALGFVGVSHRCIGLGQPAHTVGVAGRVLQPMLISVERLLIAAGHARRIAQQEPQLVVTRRSRDRTLGEIRRLSGLSPAQCIFRGARQASDFDAAAPSDAGVVRRSG